MTHAVILSGDLQRQRAHALIDRAPPGYVVKITEPTRTQGQNNKLWAMLTDVSRAKPEGRRHVPDVWKALFMQACGHEQQFEMGLDGRPFPLGFRSSRLKVQQMNDLIECIYAYGAKHGVQWTDEASA